jgi:gliding motility-associated lipoprotein GldD
MRTDFPEKQYQLFNPAGYPYRFAYPADGRIVPDTTSYRHEPYWINLKMPHYNATVHISYKRVQGNLPELLDDTYSFVYRHVIKADAISTTLFENREKNVYGILYELDGDVASPVQFYATDSVRHFLRGSLYFFNTPNADSLAPYIAFLTRDIEYLMHTTEWK